MIYCPGIWRSKPTLPRPPKSLRHTHPNLSYPEVAAKTRNPLRASLATVQRVEVKAGLFDSGYIHFPNASNKIITEEG